MAGYGVGNIIFTRQDWNDKDIFTILTAHGDKFLSHLLFMHVHLPPAHLILSMLFKKKTKTNVYTVCMHGHILSSLPPKFNNISIIKKWCVSQHFFHCSIVLTLFCIPRLSSVSACLPTHELLSGCRVYLLWHLHMEPFSVSSQVCWQPPLPWLQVTVR